MKKNKILSIFIAIASSIVISIFFLLYHSDMSLIVFTETAVLLSFFLIIVLCPQDRFNPFSFFMLNLFLGFLDIIFVIIDVRIIDNKYDIHIYEKSLLIIIVWFFFFIIGYYFKVNRKKIQIKELSIINNIVKNVNLDILLAIGVLIQFFIAFIIIKTVIEVGGISVAMNNFAVYKHNNQGYLTTLLPLLSIVTLVLFEKKMIKSSFLSMIFNFILIAITGRRSLSITTVIIPFLIFVNYRVKRITNKEIAIVAIPLVIFILFIGSMRNQAIELNNNNSGILNIMASVTNTIQYGQNIPDLVYELENGEVQFQKGKFLLNGILGMVPRAIWKEKPEPDHSLITSRLIYYDDITYGKPVSACGFSYLCFGYLGVVLSGLICGKFTSLMYEWLQKEMNTIVILIYSILIQSITLITNPESQLKIITLFGIIMIISIICNFIKKRNVENEKRCDF